MSFKYLIMAVAATMISTGIMGQDYHTRSNKALRYYLQGKSELELLFIDQAESNLKIATDVDKGFYEAWLTLGQMYNDKECWEDAVHCLSQAVKIDSLFFIPAIFSLGKAEARSGRYAKAKMHMKAFLASGSASTRLVSEATEILEDCDFALSFVNLRFTSKRVNLGDSVNTTLDEYWPSVVADGSTLYFTRELKRLTAYGPDRQEDFYVSTLKDSVWGKARSAGAPLNTPGNEGAQTISSDGRSMYFTACDREDGIGRCDIYYATLEGTRWTVGTNIGSPVNSRYWESQPSISADGRMLFFVSNRPGGVGGMDLWYSVKRNNGAWSTPVNPGIDLNSKGDEFSPFIYFDGRTLYFSSNGRKSFGGFDIFSSVMKNDSTWTEPENLGPAVNTPSDETGLVISATGRTGYFSSSEDKSKGKDLYSITIPEEIAPDPVSYLHCIVRDKQTGLPIRAAVDLSNVTLNIDMLNMNTDKEGSFLVCLPQGCSYGLDISADGYMFYSENFDFESGYNSTEPYLKTIYLKPVKVGETIRMYNVFYTLDSWELMNSSLPELEKLYGFMERHPEMKVDISGHTDATGSDEHNRVLSEKRAQSVREYLISRGIQAKRMVCHGYGESKPVSSNDDEEGRRLNRRTEVTVVSMGTK